MTTHTLPRTGDVPLRFDGELIAEVTESPPPFKRAKHDTRRWFELRLFSVPDGRYVVAIGFRTGRETELPADDVFVCDSEQDVIDLLSPPGNDSECRQSYDPTEHVEGFPELHESHPKFQKWNDRHDRLMARIEDEFDRRVGVLLERAGFVEELT